MNLSRGILGAIGGAAQGYGVGKDNEFKTAMSGNNMLLEDIRAQNLARFQSKLRIDENIASDNRQEAFKIAGEGRKTAADIAMKDREPVGIDSSGRTITWGELKKLPPEEQAKAKTKFSLEAEKAANDKAQNEATGAYQAGMLGVNQGELALKEKQEKAKGKTGIGFKQWSEAADWYDKKWVSANPESTDQVARANYVTKQLRAAGYPTTPPGGEFSEASGSPGTQPQPGAPNPQDGNVDLLGISIEKVTSGQPEKAAEPSDSQGSTPAPSSPEPTAEGKGILSGSMNLGTVLGGAVKSGVSATKAVAGAVPGVGDFVNENVAKMAYGMSPIEAAKFLMGKSAEFSAWWAGAAENQRKAFLDKVNTEARQKYYSE